MDRLRKLQTVASVLLSNILLLHAMVLNSRTIGVIVQRKFSEMKKLQQHLSTDERTCI